MLMPWGKHKGLPISEIPGGYLFWVLESCDIKGELKQAIQMELASRLDVTPVRPKPVNAGKVDSAVILRWYRRAAVILHPDHGGSVQSMQLLNELKDLVKG